MADKDIISVSSIGNAGEAGKKLKKVFGDIDTTTISLLGNITGGFSKLTTILKGTGLESLNLKKSMADMFGGGTNGAKNLATTVAAVLPPVKFSLVRDLIDPTKTAADAVNHMGKDVQVLNSILKKLITTQNIARTAIMATSNGTGTFAEKMKNATNIAEAYPASLHRSAASTGFFTTELLAFDKASRMIPGAFKGINISVRDFGGVLARSTLTSTQMMAVALRGLGFEAGEMTGQFQKVYAEFGQKGKSAALSLAEIKMATKGTTVHSKLAYEQISASSQAFAIFGGTVSSAAETWRDFNMALRDTVPVGEINKLVTSVTRGITTMTLQHRAFIAQVSGAAPGSGMLGGALKMEMALRTPEGMGKNMDALTQTLSQFAGGKIITLEQAVEMPELETQFVLQRQLLGQLTSVQGNEQQNRMLEVLSNVQTGGRSRLDASKEVGDLMKGGVSLQQQGVTFLEKIAFSTRQFTHIFNNHLNKLNTPLSAGMGEIASNAAKTTKGREVPLIPKIGIGNIVKKTYEQMKRDNPRLSLPGGLPTREELGIKGSSGGKTVGTYQAPETPNLRGQKVQTYFSDPFSTIKSERLPTGPTKTASEARGPELDSSLLILNKLENTIRENINVIGKEANTPIKLELTSSCPDCNQSKMEKLMGERGGVYRGANV